MISLFLSMISLAIVKYITKKDPEKYPFGKNALEPLIVILKSVVLIIMCSLSFKNAIVSIFNGGNDIDSGLALLYSVVSTIGCGLILFYMKLKSKKLKSELVKVEAAQWLMDTVLSAGVLGGFFISILLSKTSLHSLTTYVDPLMVIICSIVFIKYPIESLISGIKEITNFSAESDINDDIYTLVKEIEEEYQFEESITRVSKVGRMLRIEIDFVFNEDSKMESLEEMDLVREKIDKETSHLGFKKWMNVTFTGNRKWAI